MELSIRVVVVIFVILVAAAIMITLMTSWAQGSGGAMEGLMNWIKGILGG